MIQQVLLPGHVLRVPRVELHDPLRGAERDVVDRQRLHDHVPRDPLRARRRRQAAAVLVHVGPRQQVLELAEVEARRRLRVRAGLRDLVEVREDAGEEGGRGGVVDLDQEPDDGGAGPGGVCGGEKGDESQFTGV